MPIGDLLPSVEWMNDGAPRQPCYLVEWYLPAVGIDGVDESETLLAALAAMAGDDSLVRVMVTLAVPTDEVVFAVLSAQSADMVDAACRSVGHPAQRVSPAIGLRLAGL